MSDLIRTTSELKEACAVCRKDGLASLDTEFVWKTTYRPVLGIVQLGSREQCWAIDAMTALDSTPLRELIEDENVVKILHDARQDLQHLHRWTGANPVNVFDTQLAAAFTDFPHGIGLQKLLQDAIDIALPKTETLTDWTQRPLTSSQIAYALDDVRYLPALKDELIRRASELGTLEWMFEEQAKYDDAALYEELSPEDAWLKLRLRRLRLDARQRAILQAVAACREEIAQQWNLPRSWLGDDSSLIDMALKGRVGRIVHRYKGGAESLRALYTVAIERARRLTDEECPPNPNRYYIEEVRDAADCALEFLAEKAAALHVDASVIANRATLTAFIDDVNDESNPLANGWRYEAVGKEIAERYFVE